MNIHTPQMLFAGVCQVSAVIRDVAQLSEVIWIIMLNGSFQGFRKMLGYQGLAKE